MTNYDMIIKMNECDLLTRLNDSSVCVVENLGKLTREEALARCEKYDCRHCIEKFLSEEAR